MAPTNTPKLSVQRCLAIMRIVSFSFPHANNIGIGLYSGNTIVRGRIKIISKGRVGPEEAVIRERAAGCVIVVYHDSLKINDNNI